MTNRSREEMARAVSLKIKSLPNAALPVDAVICGNSIEVLKTFPENSVDLILSDIPYGIGLDDWDVLHKNSNAALGGKSPAQKSAGAVFKRRGKPINGWSEADKKIPFEYQQWCSTWSSEWLRILRPGGSAIIFAGRRYAHRCIVALEDAEFNFRDLLGWTRPRAVHRAQRISVVFERRGDDERSEEWQGWRLGNLRPKFEPIIWAFKPYRITIADNVIENSLGAYNQNVLERHFGTADNIFHVGMKPGEGGLHEAQKPEKLMDVLIELVTKPGQIVLDPFAGSGTTLVSAKRLDRHFIGIERNPEFCALINKRLEPPILQTN